MLELRTVGVHPVHLLVEGEVCQGFPGRLEAVDVHRVDSTGRVVTD